MAEAAIIAVGSELCRGKTVNTNASWLSERLVKDIGMEVALHLAVPDELQVIQDALDFTERLASNLFICGGLGPTKDDLTRDALSLWAHAPLEFCPAPWERVQSKLNRHGVQILERHRRECMLPKGAVILENPAGTAEGFQFIGRGKRIWVFPGPPKELQTVFLQSAVPHLKSLYPNLLDNRKEIIFYTRQIPESDVSEQVEAAFEGLEGITIAFRLDWPRVEVRLEFDSKLEAAMEERLKSVVSHYGESVESVEKR